MIQQGKYFSSVYGEDREYQIILPEMTSADARYPVLYLLHGKEQNYLSWTRYTFLELMAKNHPYITVMPNGDDRWYHEFPTGYERYIAYLKEFIEFIDAHYPTLPGNRHRGFTGISMGGYGAFLVGFKHPELVGSVSALSGVLNITNHLDKKEEGLNYGLPVDKGKWDDLNLLVLARDAADLGFDILFDSGTDDEISYQDSVDFHQALLDAGITHSFHLYPGRHEWIYWDEHLEEHLAFHFESFFGGKNCDENYRLECLS